MPDYVFLSYSRSDRTYVDFLVRRLVAEGIPYWIDHERGSGDEWAARVEESLAGASAVIVVVSPKAAASPQVEHEVRRARELGKPILPLVRRRATWPLIDDLVVAGEGISSAHFYEQVRSHTGGAAPTPPEAEELLRQSRVRLPHRLGPIPRTPVEVWGVRALVAAALFLALAGVFSGDWNLFLVFPAFGIPDLLFAWFRRRRFLLAGRWSTDVRAAILLAGSTAYLTVSAILKVPVSGRPFLLIGVAAAIVLGWAGTAIWVAQTFRDRPR
jgi:hypothetical protein